MSVPGKSSPIPALETMIELIRTLRGPDGCPWDRKQTPRSIANYLVEEVYELVDAIDRQNVEQVLEELGENDVRMRVTLSYFVEPNPPRRGYVARHQYASHGLRFSVRRPNRMCPSWERDPNGWA